MNNINTQYSEEQLMQMLSNGNESAFKILMEQHRERIYTHAMRFLKSHDMAEEVVHDVFLKLWLNRNNLHHKGPIEGWIFTVARNNVINRNKKIQNENKVINELKISYTIEDNSTQTSITFSEYQHVANQAINQLTEKQLTIYNLARHENLSYSEIAQMLNISPLTVKTHMSRALCQIRAFLTARKVFTR